MLSIVDSVLVCCEKSLLAISVSRGGIEIRVERISRITRENEWSIFKREDSSLFKNVNSAENDLMEYHTSVR